MRYFAIAAPIVWAAIVLFLHLMTLDIDPDSGMRIPHADKMVHFCMFGLLAFLMLRSYEFRKASRSSLRIKVAIWFLSIGYGALMETLQGLTAAQRDSDLFDWVADIAGSTAGIFIGATTFLPFLFKHQIRKTS